MSYFIGTGTEFQGVEIGADGLINLIRHFTTWRHHPRAHGADDKYSYGWDDGRKFEIFIVKVRGRHSFKVQ